MFQIFNMCFPNYTCIIFLIFIFILIGLPLEVPKIGATHDVLVRSTTYISLLFPLTLENNQRDMHDYVQSTPARYISSDPQKTRL